MTYVNRASPDLGPRHPTEVAKARMEAEAQEHERQTKFIVSVVVVIALAVAAYFVGKYVLPRILEKVWRIVPMVPTNDGSQIHPPLLNYVKGVDSDELVGVRIHRMAKDPLELVYNSTATTKVSSGAAANTLAKTGYMSAYANKVVAAKTASATTKVLSETTMAYTLSKPPVSAGVVQHALTTAASQSMLLSALSVLTTVVLTAVAIL